MDCRCKKKLKLDRRHECKIENYRISKKNVGKEFLWHFTRVLNTSPKHNAKKKRKKKNDQLGLQKNSYGNVHRRFIHNCPNLESTQMSFNAWMDKKLVHPYNEKLLIKSNKPFLKKLLIHGKSWIYYIK